jgi:hypothetical protein
MVDRGEIYGDSKFELRCWQLNLGILLVLQMNWSSVDNDSNILEYGAV